MEEKYIYAYKNNPTAGGTDGTKISLDSAQTAPLSALVNATGQEAAALKCALRTNAGYKAIEISVTLEGEDAAKFKVAKDNSFADEAAALAGATWAESLSYDEIGATNEIFWVKMIVTSDEKPQIDIDEKIRVDARIRAV